MSAVETFLAGNGRVSRGLYVVCRGIVAVLVRVVTRIRIEGRDHVPRRGAFVLAPVHRSYVDTPIAACVTRRRMRFMGKDSVWRFAPIGWLVSALGAFPVTRGTADRQALARCLAVLEAGEPLVLFPEGERKSGPTVQPLFDGAVYVAAKAGVPIVPVGIGGSERVMPRGVKLPRPRRVHVIVGEPLVPAGSEPGARVSRRVVREQSELLHRRLQELFDEAQRRVGAPVPDRADHERSDPA